MLSLNMRLIVNSRSNTVMEPVLSIEGKVLLMKTNEPLMWFELNLTDIKRFRAMMMMTMTTTLILQSFNTITHAIPKFRSNQSIYRISYLFDIWQWLFRIVKYPIYVGEYKNYGGLIALLYYTTIYHYLTAGVSIQGISWRKMTTSSLVYPAFILPLLLIP